jgi:hypothetical protein
VAASLIGEWTRPSEGLTEVWTVRRTAGTWELSGRYFENGMEVGSFVGSDVKLDGGTLTFVQNYEKVPPRLFLSGATVTVTPDDGKLQFTWQLGGSSGSGSLERVRR